MSVWNSKYMDGFINRTVMESGVSAFAQVRPVLAFLAGKNTAELSKLGDPSVGVFFGMNDLPEVERRQMLDSFEQEILYLTAQPDDTTQPQARGNTPTATVYGEDLYDTAGIRMTNFWTPCKVGRDEVKRAKSPGMIASVFSRALRTMTQDHINGIYDRLINGTLTSAQQGLKTWPDLLGLDHTISDGSTNGETTFNYYGRKLRTSVDHLKAAVYPASALVTSDYLSDLKPKLDLIRKLETMFSVGQRRGNGKRLVVTHPILFEVLAMEVDNKSSILRSPDSPPDHAVDGFNNPVIEYMNTYIVGDPSFPQDTMVGMYLPSWGVHIGPKANFKKYPWVDKALTEEGGAKYYWTQMETDIRVFCLEPHLQWKVTGLSFSGQ